MDRLRGGSACRLFLTFVVIIKSELIKFILIDHTH